MSTTTTEQKLQAKILLKKAGRSLDDLKLGQAPIKNGSPMVYDGETLAQGMPVFVETDTEAGYEPYPDGVYELEDGRKVEVKEGFVANISEMAQPDSQPASTDTQQDNALTPEQNQAVKRIVETHTKETSFSAFIATEEGKAMFEAAVKAEVEKQVTPIKEGYETKLSTHNKEVGDLNKTVDDLMKINKAILDVLKTKPATEPAKGADTQFSSQGKTEAEIQMEKADRIFEHIEKQRKNS